MATDPMRIAWSFPQMGVSEIDPYMKQLGEAGFNVSQVYDPFYRGTPEWQEQFLTSAQQYGMQGMPFIPTELGGEYGSWANTGMELAQQYAQDPRVWGYMNLEEPRMRHAGAGFTTQEMQASYDALKGVAPDKPTMAMFGQSSWNEPQYWQQGGQVLPYADAFGMNIYPMGQEDPYGFLEGRGGYYQTPIQAGIEAGKQFVPLIQAYGDVQAGGIQGQYDIWNQIAGEQMAGLGYYHPAMQDPALLAQMQAMNQLLGYTSLGGETDMPTPEYLTAAKKAWADYSTPIWGEAGRSGEWVLENIESEWGSNQEDILRRYGLGEFGPIYEDTPDVILPPTNGEPLIPPSTPTPTPLPPGQPANLWSEPYNFLSPQQQWPYEKMYQPPSIGPAGFPMTTAPQYRQYPYTPPGAITEQYQQYGTPDSFYQGIQTPELQQYLAGQTGAYPTYGGMGTPDLPSYMGGQQYPTYGGMEAPDLPTYMGGQAGAYPTYSPYEGALGQPTQQAIMEQLTGQGVGIPLEAQQYQTAMGRITEAERGAQEELTRLSARGGRLESGLYGGQQLDITQQGLEAKRQTAQEFAITTAEMQQQAKQQAVPMAMQMMGLGAQEKTKAYESLTQRWGAEATDKIREYEADYRKTEAQYGAEAAQEEMKYRSNADAYGAETADKIRKYEADYRKTEAEYGAGAAQEQLRYQSNADAWGAETADLFQEYQSGLQTATTQHEMEAAQNQMIQAGQERAWEAGQEEYTKAYESALNAGRSEQEAQQMAWQAGLAEWQSIYQSVVNAAQQQFGWEAQQRAWSEARWLGGAAGTAAVSFDWGAFLGGGLGALGAA